MDTALAAAMTIATVPPFPLVAVAAATTTTAAAMAVVVGVACSKKIPSKQSLTS